MGKFRDVTGQKFGRLLAIRPIKNPNYSDYDWEFECDCGNLVIYKGQSVFGNKPIAKLNKTCGKCHFAKEDKIKNLQTHGLYHCYENIEWNLMLQRCYNKKCKHFPNWGGKGITVHQSWIDDFMNFYNYLLTLPETRLQFEARTGEKATIDRINNLKNYEPGNIRWASYKQQAQNRSSTILTEQLVKFILWKSNVNNKTEISIIRLLKANYNYQGSQPTINAVIRGKSWSNININKELVEYQQFGTINGVVIVNGVVTPDNF